MTKIWNVTGGGLNLNSSPRDSIHYVHGVGPLETITLTTNDHGCISHDTMTMQIHPAPVVALAPTPTICTGDSLLLDAGPGFATYAWSNGAMLSSIYASAAIPYTISVTDVAYNCLGTATVTPVIDADCVWPGDANHDLVVDVNDFLDIGSHLEILDQFGQMPLQIGLGRQQTTGPIHLSMGRITSMPTAMAMESWTILIR